MSTPPLHPDESVTSASNISPDIVRNEEWVLRELHRPQDVPPQREIDKSDLPIGFIREGLSVHRRRYTTADFVKSAVRRRLAVNAIQGNPRNFSGVAKLSVAEIRAIQWNNRGTFTVKDTPPRLPFSKKPGGHPGHASIHFADPPNNDTEARAMRTKLLRYVKTCRISVDAAYATL